MFVKEVTVENQVGLHARPATFFIQKANEYKSSTNMVHTLLLKKNLNGFDIIISHSHRLVDTVLKFLSVWQKAKMAETFLCAFHPLSFQHSHGLFQKFST